MIRIKKELLLISWDYILIDILLKILESADQDGIYIRKPGLIGSGKVHDFILESIADKKIEELKSCGILEEISHGKYQLTDMVWEKRDHTSMKILYGKEEERLSFIVDIPNENVAEFVRLMSTHMPITSICNSEPEKDNSTIFSIFYTIDGKNMGMTVEVPNGNVDDFMKLMHKHIEIGDVCENESEYNEQETITDNKMDPEAKRKMYEWEKIKGISFPQQMFKADSGLPLKDAFDLMRDEKEVKFLYSLIRAANGSGLIDLGIESTVYTEIFLLSKITHPEQYEILWRMLNMHGILKVEREGVYTISISYNFITRDPIHGLVERRLEEIRGTSL